MSAGRTADLVERQFSAARPNQLWVADFIFVATWADLVYIAFVINVFARRIVCCCVSHSMKAVLVLYALEQALSRTGMESLVHHSLPG